MPDDTRDPTEARNLAAVLATLEDGRLHGDLSDASREMISTLHDVAANARGKAKGKITITLDYAVEDGVVELRADFTTKTPKLPRQKTVLFATPDNNLTRRDPKQPSLEFRDVTVPRAVGGLA